MQPIGAHGGNIMPFGSFWSRNELGFLNCDDICMCVENKQFELLDLHDEISLTFTVGYVCLCGVCSHVGVLGLSVRLSRYPMWVW